jgi:hypothetical protein
MIHPIRADSRENRSDSGKGSAWDLTRRDRRFAADIFPSSLKALRSDCAGGGEKQLALALPMLSLLRSRTKKQAG